ncbi:MAG: type IV secretory pathway protein, partial [Nitrosopumilaceae archaeon]|nr:type IV secretory pathway protein [Nitrosopumilaceae archaeon]
MRLKIFKDKFPLLSKQDNKKNENNVKESSLDLENNATQFMTLSKLEFDGAEIHAGITKDPTAKGGLRYQVIEPSLSERDKKAFSIIKKLLMTELSVSLT